MCIDLTALSGLRLIPASHLAAWLPLFLTMSMVRSHARTLRPAAASFRMSSPIATTISARSSSLIASMMCQRCAGGMVASTSVRASGVRTDSIWALASPLNPPWPPCRREGAAIRGPDVTTWTCKRQQRVWGVCVCAWTRVGVLTSCDPCCVRLTQCGLRHVTCVVLTACVPKLCQDPWLYAHLSNIAQGLWAVCFAPAIGCLAVLHSSHCLNQLLQHLYLEWGSGWGE